MAEFVRWIPAFAGMTEKARSGLRRVGHVDNGTDATALQL